MLNVTQLKQDLMILRKLKNQVTWRNESKTWSLERKKAHITLNSTNKLQQQAATPVQEQKAHKHQETAMTVRRRAMENKIVQWIIS